MTWSKTSRQARGYDARWDRTRALVLRRDNGLCQRCLRANRVQAGNECHHIKPKAECKRLGWTQAQTDSMDNLETLCHDCHEAADAQAQGRTLNPKTGFDVRGNPTDPDHPWNKAGVDQIPTDRRTEDRPPRSERQSLTEND